ncbi:MAG: DUF1523 family protein [Salipiger thiooxidans]|jgi:hypothetical protein|uniref:DUF1523 domain-containing protein n=1 Tax=Salipiger thiooxidans TaxID=282683 RepID=A0A1G7CD54_9RHOB|nr:MULTISPECIES: DUF1523 family protein [Salipiger]MBN8187888.1 DUF1523 family protein [Salipiger thiooxidans]NIY95163.1 DUF1523 family protein [Salipiger sp. HF18]SDE37268.1 Protein of unknown function [Salipiger thiooxidans]
MRYVKWFVIIAFWVLVAGFLHYTLPQHDVARITDTYEKRIDPGENALFWANASTGENVNLTGRDVFFIQTRLNNDKVMVYRNEDTGWGWPPYFKFDTSNLQAEAADLRSTAAAPQWVVIKHYGWRNEFLSVYPNVVSIRPVDGPDVRIIPWLNIVLLTLLVAVSWAIWVRWRRFREARIDPVLEDVGDNLDEAGGRIRGLFRRKG